MKLENFKNQKAITLVALIITVIVLLILATVSISLVINSGIISKAEYATDMYAIEQLKEQLYLKSIENKEDSVTGKLSELNLNINQDLINKYDDILYAKDGKLYLSFIAAFPDTNLYKENKEKIEKLKNSLEINYESIKAYNKVINPNFDNGINGYSITYNNVGIETEVKNDNNNKYLYIKLLDNGKTGYIDTTMQANAYNDKIYSSIKYRNSYNESNENNKINSVIIRTKTAKGFANLLLNSQNYINSYNNGWQITSDIRTVMANYETLITTLRIGGNEAQSSSQDYAMDIDDVYMLNLTEIFGAGNEPTKEQMDEIFNKF